MSARSTVSVATAAPTPPETGQLSGFDAFIGILLRFISCGLVSLAGGALWKLTLAPATVGIGSALLGIVCLLVGFVVGGILWYIRDARLRTRHPERVSDERIVFSFIVFVLMPLSVMLLLGVIYLFALFL